jgi:hypothetical protein
MSTINVDNIAEYTSSGKINATHDIKMASGKSVMNSDSKAIGSMVKLIESEVTSAVATVVQDDFVDLTLYNHYYFYIDNMEIQTDGQHLQCIFRSGGSSGSNMTGTYARSGITAETNGGSASVFGNQNTTNAAQPAASLGNADGTEAFSANGIFVPSTGTKGISTLKFETYYMQENNVARYFMTLHTFDSLTAATGLLWQMSSGNITAGKFTIYGVSR